MRDIKPFGPRIVVVDPPTGETERASGLIVPANIVMERCEVGIVVHNGHNPDDEVMMEIIGDMFSTAMPLVKIGSLVYYQGTPFRIEDFKIISLSDIVAYEEA